MLEALKEAMLSGDPAGEAAQRAADLHRQWLGFWWNHYSKEAHAGLARMYVEDERFKAYYDRVHPGAAEFLKEAILIYTGMKERSLSSRRLVLRIGGPLFLLVMDEGDRFAVQSKWCIGGRTRVEHGYGSVTQDPLGMAGHPWSWIQF